MRLSLSRLTDTLQTSFKTVMSYRIRSLLIILAMALGVVLWSVLRQYVFPAEWALTRTRMLYFCALALYAARIPQARRVLLDGCGHMVIAERPREVAAAVVEWMEAC